MSAHNQLNAQIWPVPATEPWPTAITTSNGRPLSDLAVELMLDDLCTNGPGATDSRTYASYYALAVERGLVGGAA